MSTQEPKPWDIEHHKFAVRCRIVARWILEYSAQAGRVTVSQKRQVDEMARHICDLGREYEELLDFPHGDQLLVHEHLIQEIVR